MKNSKTLIAIAIIVIAVLGVAIAKNIRTSESNTETEVVEQETDQKAASEETDTNESETEAETEASESETEAREESEEETETEADEEITVTSDNPDFDFYNADMTIEDLQAYYMPIMLTFGNKACIYCEQMKPHLMELNEEYQGEAIVKYIDMDNYPDLARKYPIYGTPAIVWINGQGEPFVPSEEYTDYFYQFSQEEGGDPVLTMSFGYMDKETVDSLLSEMI